jgi:hypothetical protein
MKAFQASFVVEPVYTVGPLPGEKTGRIFDPSKINDMLQQPAGSCGREL